MTSHPVTNEEIAALRHFEGALAFRYRALLNRALDELIERRIQFAACDCGSGRRWSGHAGRCEKCGNRTDMLTAGELGEIEQALGPSLKLTALVAEVRERRGASK